MNVRINPQPEAGSAIILFVAVMVVIVVGVGGCAGSKLLVKLKRQEMQRKAQETNEMRNEIQAQFVEMAGPEQPGTRTLALLSVLPVEATSFTLQCSSNLETWTSLLSSTNASDVAGVQQELIDEAYGPVMFFRIVSP